MSHFALEAELAAPVQRWMQRQGLRVKAEYRTPWGICDLVGIALDKHRVKQRRKAGHHKALGRIERIGVLELIPTQASGSAIRLTDLLSAAQTNMGITVERELDWLLRNGFVRWSSERSLQRMDSWAPLQQRIVAIELKLQRITEALAQANNHSPLTRERYVALPLDAARRACRLRTQDFRHAGVGLLGVLPSRCYTLLHPGEHVPPEDTLEQRHCVERFWRTHFKDS